MARKKSEQPLEAGAPRLETSEDDKKKARKWFERARELGDKRQYEPAIEYYIGGLEYWPDAVDEACKALHGCAVARRANGGPKPGLKDTMKHSMGGKDHLQAMLNAFWLFGHDPDNAGYIEGVFKNACKLRAVDTALWSAGVLRRSIETSSKPNVKHLKTTAELLDELGDAGRDADDPALGLAAYKTAIETLESASRLKARDRDIENTLRNISTKFTILKGKYQDSETFRDSISDTDQQSELHDRSRSIQSEARHKELITQAEARYAENQESAEVLKELIRLLTQREDEEEEVRAIGHLVDAFKRTGDYRWKMRADEIRMKQLRRHARAAKASGDREQYKEAAIKRLKYEMAVHKERVERYPTDNRAKFDYALRLFEAGQFDDAIPLLQVARADPKNRTQCTNLLGQCFYRKKYFGQAIPTLRQGLSEHNIQDDTVAKDMRYYLGKSYLADGKLDDARRTLGELLQIDYNFRDVRELLDRLESQTGGAAS